MLPSAAGPGESQFALYAGGPNRPVLEGELDVMLGETLADLLAALPAADHVRDLRKLSFIDGHSAWILHNELTSRRRGGQSLVVAGAPPVLRRLRTICGFDPSLMAA